MSILAQEYNSLQDRQEAIKQDMLGVAAAIEKLDSGLGKKIAAEIGSTGLNTVGVPIKIPTQFGYASLGLLGLIPSTIEANKMKKYKARLQELETEYNANALRLQEIDAQAKSETVKNNNKSVVGSSTTKSKTSIIGWVVLALLSIGVFVWVKKKSIVTN